MEEQIIIKSQKEELKVFQIVCGIIAVIAFVIPILDYAKRPDLFWNSFSKYVSIGSALPEICWSISLVVVAIAVVFSLMYAKVELTVTNKRIYGLAAFGKRVDLPLDSVAAVGTSAFKTISITSASGAIKFGMIRNFQEIHSEISKLLVERQAQKQTTTQTTIKQEIPQSNADELKKYKDLLDNGVITQEEFDAKKKQLLGL